MNLRDLAAILAYHSGSADTFFIHIPKNAGVSLRKAPALSRRVISASPYFYKSKVYVRELRRVMEEGGHHHGLAHARLREIRTDVRARLKVAAIIRNPWSRVVSRYEFARMAAEQGKLGPDLTPPSFEAFLDQRHEYGGRPYFWHRAVLGWYPQRDYVVDEDDRVAADLLRFEYMDSDVMAYFGLDEPIRRRNVTKSSESKKRYQDYYSDRTRQIVADWYADDIDSFGFTFDGPATRNIWTASED